MAALPTKTPVSLLQELCVRKGITPKYDLVQIEGAVHEPTFKNRVTVAEFSDFGSGQSKKKAKHSAAKAILDKLLGSQAFGGALSETATDGTIVSNHVSGNSYDDGIQGNPIGTLQELCMSRRWPPPIYDLNAEEGLPHERQFTINCIVGKYKEPGAGKSKKVAKRQAAYKMLQKLKDVPLEPNQMGIAAEDGSAGTPIPPKKIDIDTVQKDLLDRIEKLRVNNKDIKEEKKTENSAVTEEKAIKSEYSG